VIFDMTSLYLNRAVKCGFCAHECEIGRHLRQVKAIGAEFNVGFFGIGGEELPWMPKGRYKGEAP
jgi:gamma-glutamylcysteine synthetase